MMAVRWLSEAKEYAGCFFVRDDICPGRTVISCDPYDPKQRIARGLLNNLERSLQPRANSRAHSLSTTNICVVVSVLALLLNFQITSILVCALSRMFTPTSSILVLKIFAQDRNAPSRPTRPRSETSWWDATRFLWFLTHKLNINFCFCSKTRTVRFHVLKPEREQLPLKCYRPLFSALNFGPTSLTLTHNILKYLEWNLA